MRALRHEPAFVLLCAGQALSTIGSGVLFLAILLAVYDRTGSGVATSLVFLAETAPLALLSLWAGALADRVDRRRLVLGADVVRAALLLPLLLPDPVGHLGLLCAVLAAQASVDAVFRPAFAGLLPQTVPRDLLPSANAVWATAGGLAGVVAPLLGGALYAVGGLRLVVLVDMSSFLVAAVLVALVRNMRPPKTGDIPAQPTTRSAVAIVRSTPALRRFFLAATAFAVANAVLFPVLVPFLRGTLQASAAEVGLLFAVLSAAGLLTAPVSGPLMQRFGPRVVYRAGAAGTTVGLLLLGLSPDIDTATIAVVFIGMPSVCFGVAQTTLLQQAVPDSQLGRIFGVLATLMALVKLVAAVLPLALLSLLGTRGTLLSAVVACALGTVVVIRERPEQGTAAVAQQRRRAVRHAIARR